MKYVFPFKWISEDLEFKQPHWRGRSLCCLGSLDHFFELRKVRDYVLPIFPFQGPAQSLAPRKHPDGAWAPGWQALWWFISVRTTSSAPFLAAVNKIDIGCHEKTHHTVIFQVLLLNPRPWPGWRDNRTHPPTLSTIHRFSSLVPFQKELPSQKLELEFADLICFNRENKFKARILNLPSALEPEYQCWLRLPHG